MAKWQTMYSADYINAAEIPEGKQWTLTITGVKGATLEDEKGKRSGKAVVSFREMDRGLVLAKTNAILIAAMFGEDTEAWKGKRITIHAEMVKVGPDTAPGVRVLGSPDLERGMSVTVKLARKRPFTVQLKATGIRANGSARPPAQRDAAPPPPPADDDPGPPPDGAADTDPAAGEHIDF